MCRDTQAKGKKVNVTHEPKSQTVGVYSSNCKPRSISSPPSLLDEMVVHHMQGYHQQYVAGTHLHT